MNNKTAAINRTIDIVGLVGDLRKSGRFYIGPCPFCGGHDRFNAKLADNGQLWLCRMCGDGKYHDAIAFLMQRDNLTFAEVLAAYGGGAVPMPSPLPITSSQRPRPGMDCAPSAEWQRAALAAAEEAAAFLRGLTPQAVKVRRYLTQERGLQADMIKDALLGFNPSWRQIDGLRLAPGVTIPGRVGGQLWYLQVRVTKAARDKAAGRGRPLDKYHALTGSRLKALFRADTLLAAETAIVTEGEFDALLLAQYLPAGWAAVTMGAASTLPDNPAWLRYFAAVRRVYLVMDNDPAGAKAVERWRQLLPWVDLLPVPAGYKDVTEYWRAGGDLAAWVMGEPLPQVTQTEPAQELPQVDGARLVIFPADTPLAFPAGTWERRPDGRIAARLTLAGLKLVKAWRDMLAGEDVPECDLIPATSQEEAPAVDQAPALVWLAAYETWQQDSDAGNDAAHVQRLAELAIAGGLPCYSDGVSDAGRVGWQRLAVTYDPAPAGGAAGHYNNTPQEKELLTQQTKAANNHDRPLPWATSD